MEVRPERRRTLGLRWITTYSRARNEKTMKERLANEILDALNNQGGACKKRTILIRWLKLTRLSHIISGNQKQMSYPGAKPRVIPELRRNL